MAIKTGGERVSIPLGLPALLTRRVTAAEWDRRDEVDAKIPIGTIAVEFPEHVIRDVRAGQFELPAALANFVESGLVPAYLVIGYADTDQRPLCVELFDVSQDRIPLDLPLIPLVFGDLSR